MVSQIKALASALLQNAEVLEKAIEEAGVDNYDFSHDDSPVALPFLGAEGAEAQVVVISAAQEILRHAAGPLGYLIGYPAKIFEVGTIRALAKLEVPSLIPLGKSVSYDELASKLAISKELLQRLIRFAITCGFLAEDDKGDVKHNALSAVFVKDSQAAAAAAFNFDVHVNAATKIYEALKLSGDGLDPSKVPVSVAYQQGDHLPTLWEVNGSNPALGKGFHSLMAISSTLPEYSMDHVTSAFDWSQIKKLVDVGGSLGHASLAIAKHFPNVTFVIQDKKETIQMGSAVLEPTLSSRISFAEHDFFQPQSVIADAYLYRFIIHDWTNADVERILKAALPAFRLGARLLIMDMVVPDLGTQPESSERSIRGLDITMYGFLGGKERSLDEFRRLVAQVEPKLEFEDCKTPGGSLLSLMSWVYRD